MRARCLRSPRTVLAPYLRRIAGRVGLREPEPITPLLMRERAATGWEAWAAYRPQPYAGTVTLFRAEERDGTLADALTIWREVARGGLVVEEVRGGHNEMLIEPNVEVLAERLSARLTDDAAAVREDQLPRCEALRCPAARRRPSDHVPLRVGGRPAPGHRPRLLRHSARVLERPPQAGISRWALRLRNSSEAHRARASWTVGSIRNSTCLRSWLTYRASRC